MNSSRVQFDTERNLQMKSPETSARSQSPIAEELQLLNTRLNDVESLFENLANRIHPVCMDTATPTQGKDIETSNPGCELFHAINSINKRLSSFRDRMRFTIESVQL